MCVETYTHECTSIHTHMCIFSHMYMNTHMLTHTRISNITRELEGMEIMFLLIYFNNIGNFSART